MNSTSNYSSEQSQDSASAEPVAPPTSQPNPPATVAKSKPASVDDADSAELEIGVIVQDNSLPGGVPPVGSACVLHGEEPLDGYTRVIMTPDSIAQVKAHAESNTRVELGGLLLGRAYTHNEHVFVEVECAIPAESADKGSVHFTFTADTWQQLNRASAAYPDLVVVGWFHTHPNLGVFFSTDDEVVHTTFPHRWMVGLVVDPVREQVNYFGWRDGQIGTIGGFYESLSEGSSDDESAQATMPWRVMIDGSWFNTYYGMMSGTSARRSRRSTDPSGGSETAAVAPFDAGLPPISPWVGALLGAASLTISLVTLGLVVYEFWLQ